MRFRGYCTVVTENKRRKHRFLYTPCPKAEYLTVCDQYNYGDEIDKKKKIISE